MHRRNNQRLLVASTNEYGRRTGFAFNNISVYELNHSLSWCIRGPPLGSVIVSFACRSNVRATTRKGREAQGMQEGGWRMRPFLGHWPARLPAEHRQRPRLGWHVEPIETRIDKTSKRRMRSPRNCVVGREL